MKALPTETQNLIKVLMSKKDERMEKVKVQKLGYFRGFDFWYIASTRKELVEITILYSVEEDEMYPITFKNELLDEEPMVATDLLLDGLHLEFSFRVDTYDNISFLVDMMCRNINNDLGLNLWQRGK